MTRNFPWHLCAVMAAKDEEDDKGKASEFKDTEDEVDDEKALKYEDYYEGSEEGT